MVLIGANAPRGVAEGDGGCPTPEGLGERRGDGGCPTPEGLGERRGDGGRRTFLSGVKEKYQKKHAKKGYANREGYALIY